jgi:hypothetical protein
VENRCGLPPEFPLASGAVQPAEPVLAPTMPEPMKPPPMLSQPLLGWPKLDRTSSPSQELPSAGFPTALKRAESRFRRSSMPSPQGSPGLPGARTNIFRGEHHSKESLRCWVSSLVSSMRHLVSYSHHSSRTFEDRPVVGIVDCPSSSSLAHPLKTSEGIGTVFRPLRSFSATQRLGRALQQHDFQSTLPFPASRLAGAAQFRVDRTGSGLLRTCSSLQFIPDHRPT